MAAGCADPEVATDPAVVVSSTFSSFLSFLGASFFSAFFSDGLSFLGAYFLSSLPAVTLLTTFATFLAAGASLSKK